MTLFNEIRYIKHYKRNQRNSWIYMHIPNVSGPFDPIMFIRISIFNFQVKCLINPIFICSGCRYVSHEPQPRCKVCMDTLSIGVILLSIHELDQLDMVSIKLFQTKACPVILVRLSIHPSIHPSVHPPVHAPIVPISGWTVKPKTDTCNFKYWYDIINVYKFSKLFNQKTICQALQKIR